MLAAYALFLASAMSGCVDLHSNLGPVPNPPPAGQLQIIPNAVDFKNVAVGQRNTQSIQISNIGSSALQVTKTQTAAAGFAITAPPQPFTLVPGDRQTLTLAFAPGIVGPAQGSLAIYTAPQTSPVIVPLQGVGEQPRPQLQISTTSLSFGDVPLRSSLSQPVTLVNAGNQSVNLTGTLSGSSGFAFTDLPAGIALSPQQQVVFKVFFSPQIPGAAQATLGVTSPNLATSLLVSLSGKGVTAPQASKHSVTLRWLPSDGASGYVVYRSQTSGGPYARFTPTPVNTPQFVDSNVALGTTYYYVVTAVQKDLESGFSNEIAVQIPNV
jgi:hypothetical protein